METSPPLIGLTKEQLEKYRNDPFWKPFRMFMFVLFWLVWIAMFAGAILIVVLSPKCAPKLEPEWWRTKVSYQIFTPSFRDSNGDGLGDFNGIREKLDELRKIGVQNVWAAPVIATDKDDFAPFDVVDFDNVDSRFGTMDEFKMLVNAIHNREMKFVMDLPISTTSQKHIWFEKSKKGDVDFRDFYLWKKADEAKGDPSYTSLEGTTDAYMAYEGKDPVLNWKNEGVKKEIIKAAKNYLDIGVDGFHIGYVNQLGKDHELTSNSKEALEALEYFKTELETYVNGSDELKEKKIAIFTSLEDITQLNDGVVHDLEHLNVGSMEYVIDDSAKALDQSDCVEGVAKCVYDMLQKSLAHFQRANLPHVWQFTDYRVSRPTSRFDAATGNLLTFLQLTLPGAIEIYYGQELGLTDVANATRKFTGLMQWDDSEKAGFTNLTNENLFFGTTSDYKTANFKVEYGLPRTPLKTFQKLARMRQRDDTLVLGHMELDDVQHEVIKFTRKNKEIKNGAVYVAVANFAMNDNSVDIRPNLPSDMSKRKVEIAAITANVEQYSPGQQFDAQKDLLKLAPKQGVLIKVS